MATYNGERFIKDQIESILNQTYQHWRLLIHDDGSSDGTLNIIKRYSSKYPEKIILIEDGIKCGGARENFSHLMEITKREFINAYDYIMLADQDDVWFPEKIEISLNEILGVKKNYKNDKPMLVFTDAVVCNEELKPISNSLISYLNKNPNFLGVNRLIIENPAWGCTMIFNKTLLQMATPIPKEAIMHDWWLVLVASFFGKVHFLGLPTLFYRRHSSNDSKLRKLKFFTIFKYFLNLKELLSSVNLRKQLTINQIRAFLNHYESKIKGTKEYYILSKYSQLGDMKLLERKVFLIKENILYSDKLKMIGEIIFF